MTYISVGLGGLRAITPYIQGAAQRAAGAMNLQTTKTRRLRAAAGGLLAAVLLCSASETVTGAPPTAVDLILKADVLAQEVELVRLEMGRPLADELPLEVEGAAPRDLYYQALTLLHKSDRLAQEWTQDTSSLPPPVKTEIEQQHVYHVMDAALKRMAVVKERLGISEVPVKPRERHGLDHSEAFEIMHHTNRQLNLLLDQQYSPRNVYHQLTICIDLAARLLKRFPESTPIPAAPGFVRRKQPADVYERLLVCYERLHTISVRSKQQMLLITPAADTDAHLITPSDVYDLATLLRAQLEFLDQVANARPSERAVYIPGRKVPSDVFQRSGILHQQLRQLESFSETYPMWLDRGVLPQ